MIRILAALILMTVPAAAANQGYFACLHLAPGQSEWFTHSNIVACCNLADGMPTRYEERPEGIFVPPFSEAFAEATACKRGNDWVDDKPGPHDHWVMVYPTDVLKTSNPIGVAVVWWTQTSYGPDQNHSVRCFIGLPRT
jgi:hypothetical protein